MDLERALVTKIVSTGKLEDAITKGVRSDLFADEECQDVYDFIVTYSRQYGSVPSQKALQDEKSGFDIELVQDPLDYLINKFVARAKLRLAQDMVLELAEMTKDPAKGSEIDNHFLEASRKLATLVPSVETHNFVGDMPKRIKGYKERVASGHIFGLPWGFPSLDRWTKGFRKTDYNVVAGFTGIGKSTFLRVVAFNLWTTGRTPLYVTLEEEAEDIAARWDAMAAALDFEKLSQLDLNDEEMAKWEDFYERAQRGSAEIPVIDRLRNCTPNHIYGETVRHKPDLVIVDYVQLLRSASGRYSRNMPRHEVLVDITQELKQNARALGVPILAAAQTNRDGGKQGAELDNIGGSISITQDADVAVGLYSDDDMRRENEIEVRVMKNRRGKLSKFRSCWNHEQSVYRELGGRDFFRRERQRQNGD